MRPADTDQGRPQEERAAQQAQQRLTGAGFRPEDARVIVDHFVAADRHGKSAHGLARMDWLLRLPDLQPDARPRQVADRAEYARWDSCGALGYLTLEAIVRAQLADPPAHVRLVVSDASPTGTLGVWVRRLAVGGLIAVLTAISPRRLASPDGGPPLTGTNPVAIAIPSSDGRPLVVDVSMGAVTHGDVLLGNATEAELVPFGGRQAYKAFALAVGLQMFCEALAGAERGAVLMVASPTHDPVPAFRRLAGEIRLPGDS